MTTVQFTGSGGYVRMYDSSYPDLRNGAGTVDVASDSQTSGPVGQFNATGLYYNTEIFLVFNTSSIPDDATISDATLTMTISSDQTDTAFTVQAVNYSYFPELTSADYRSQSQLIASTLVAEASLSSAVSNGQVVTFVSWPEFAGVINKTGWTGVCLYSKEYRNGTAPPVGGNRHEYVFYLPPVSTVEYRPVLEVTYTTEVQRTDPTTFTAVLAGRKAKTLPWNVYLSELATRFILHDAELANAFSAGTQLDTTLLAHPNTAALLDALLDARRSAGAGFDLSLVGELAASGDWDAVLQGPENELVLDALLAGWRQASATMDTELGAYAAAPAAFDAWLLGILTAQMGFDTALFGTSDTSASLDASLAGISSGSAGFDAFLDRIKHAHTGTGTARPRRPGGGIPRL